MSIVTFSKLGKMGRLGNQMFQIASTAGIALDNGLDFGFPENKYFPHLPKFGLSCPNTYTEPRYEFDQVVLSKDSNWDLSGYFQSHKYFSHHWEPIRTLLRFPDYVNRYAIEILSHYGILGQASNICSLHIRRTDYLTKPDHHPVLSDEYYQKAISLLPEDVKTILVFSDDRECHISTGTDKKIIYMNGFEMEDLCMMSMCNYHIIANSTFSWWGQFLSGRKGQVFAPAKNRWFGPAYAHKSVDDLYQDHWTLIDC